LFLYNLGKLDIVLVELCQELACSLVLSNLLLKLDIQLGDLLLMGAAIFGVSGAGQEVPLLHLIQHLELELLVLHRLKKLRV
jgi:hypothetical protein